MVELSALSILLGVTAVSGILISRLNGRRTSGITQKAKQGKDQSRKSAIQAIQAVIPIVAIKEDLPYL